MVGSSHQAPPHDEMPARLRRTPLPLRALLACTVALACLLVPAGALANETSSLGSSPVTDATADELQLLVEQTAAAYEEAVALREELDQQVADTQARIDELNARLPALQDAAAAAMKTAYKYQQSGNTLVDLILSAEDFAEFITMMQYLDSIQEHNNSQVEELVATVAQLEQEQASLIEQQAQAAQAQEDAQQALADAEAARDEAHQRAEEEAAAQAAAAQAALEAQAAQAAAGNEASRQAANEAGAAQASSDGATDAATDASSDVTTDGSSDASSDDSYVEPSSDDGSSDSGSTEVVTDDRSAYVAEWGARIDAFLAGSPLAGYGSTFAAAAWDYGVDPRWSPAIALVESGLGASCFLPYNAWGWGSVSWSSWEEAIYGHVAGLARGYGYTITYEAACTYCPPNADYWYSAVLSAMNSI